jgi:predicted transcriptional regulator
MKLSEVKEILRADLISGDDNLDVDVLGGAASDLMSDLLRKSQAGAVLLTGLTSIQAVNTAVIGGVAAIVFVRGKKPDKAVISHAKKHKMPVLSTPFNMFLSCGKLYAKGLQSIQWLP